MTQENKLELLKQIQTIKDKFNADRVWESNLADYLILDLIENLISSIESLK